MDLRYYVGFLSEWMGVIAVAWLLSLSPRFQKPPVGFRYARRDGLVALALYGLILVFAVIFYSTNSPVFREPFFLAPAPLHNPVQALLVAGLCLLPFIAALVIRKQPARSAGWNPPLLSPSLQAGFAMAFLTIFLRNRVMDVLGGLAGPVLGILPLAVGISLAEETIFRGYIQMRLGWWLGSTTGLVLSAVLFTLWHAAAWISALPVETVLILSGLTFVQGLVLGWIMRKTGHVLAPALYRSISIWVQFLG